MRVLSLCDGVSGGQQAFDMLGIKFNGVENTYYASEIAEYSIKVTQKNYPTTIQLGDMTALTNDFFDSLGEIDILLSGTPCFTGESLVLTDNGYKYIKDIRSGDLVLTHKNRYMPVKTLMINGNKEVYKLKIMCSEDIETTPEHPFYVREMTKVYKNRKEKEVRVFKDPEWVKAKDLNKNYYVGVAINKESKIPRWNGIMSSTGHTDILKNDLSKFMDNENFWWLIGRYIGDGWYSEYKRKNRKNSYVRRVTICCSKKKNELEDIKLKLEGLFNYSISEERTVYKIQIASHELVEFVKKFGKYADGKFLNKDIFDLPKELLQSFLDGYLSADGHYREKQDYWQCNSVSRELIYGIGQCVAKAYDTPFSIYKLKVKSKTEIEGRIVNQRDQYILRFKKDVRKQDKAFYEDGYVWCPIYDLIKKEEREIVYNLEVETDNTYTVNNVIVHNCKSLSRTHIGNYNEGLDGSSKLFWDFVRIKDYIKPKYFLFENVESMKDSDRDIITEALGVEPIMINSSLFTAQDRKRYYWTNIPILPLPEESPLVLKDIMIHNPDEKLFYKQDFEFHGWDKKQIATLNLKCHDIGKRVYNPNMKCATLTAVTGGYQEKKVYDNGRCRKLTPLEYERLQGMKDNYTEGIANSKRYCACGDGWTIPVIAHILKGLKEYI